MLAVETCRNLDRSAARCGDADLCLAKTPAPWYFTGSKTVGPALVPVPFFGSSLQREVLLTQHVVGSYGMTGPRLHITRSTECVRTAL